MPEPMFDLSEKRLAWIDVSFPAFASDGDAVGKRVERTVEIQVELVDSDEFARLFVDPFDDDGVTPKPGIAADDPRLTSWPTINDDVRVNRIVTGWRGIVAGKTPVPFTPDNLAKMMKVPNFPLAFFKRYANAWAGREEQRAGNSDASLAIGQADDAS